MTSPYVNKLVKDTGRPVTEIEKKWDEAKRITAETLGKKEDDFGKTEYDYAYGIVMNMYGKKEAIVNPEVFLNSGKEQLPAHRRRWKGLCRKRYNSSPDSPADRYPRISSLSKR